MKEPNMFHNYETEKITRKASDAAEYIYVRFFRLRSSCTTHLTLFSEHPPIYASRLNISGGRTKQRYNCRFWRVLVLQSIRIRRHSLSI